MVSASPSGSDFSLYAIEERIELIVFLLRNGIIFMVVALCASNSEAKKYLSCRISAVDSIGNIKFIRVGPSLLIERNATVEAGCNSSRIAGIREQIARHVFHDKTVIGFIAVEGVYDVIPVEPHGAHGVVVIAVGISVAGEIKPVLSHALSVMGRVDHRIDEIGILFRREGGVCVCSFRQGNFEKGRKPSQFIEVWWQTAKVERDASYESFGAGLGRGFHFVAFKL